MSVKGIMSSSEGIVLMARIGFILFLLLSGLFAGCDNERTETDVIHETTSVYGEFVDTQGTDMVYNSLTTRQGDVGENEAIISIYRQGRLEGSFVDNGNGKLAFSSEDGSVKGIIIINGQGGACFQVIEISGESPFSVGEEFLFPSAE